MLSKGFGSNPEKEEVTVLFTNLEKTINTIKLDAHKEGLMEGRMEEKEQTGREMLRDRVQVDVISKYTKLPPERIHALAKQL